MKSFAQKLFGKDARYKFRHFFSIMIPILVTQSAIMGMNFFDTVMSGRAGAEQLAGTSIGTNLWMPVFTTINGILIAATPLTASLAYAMTGFFLAMIYGPMTKVVAENTEPLHAVR